MKTCRVCIHYEVCKQHNATYHTSRLTPESDVSERCYLFSDNNKYSQDNDVSKLKGEKMTKEDCLGNYLRYCKFPCTMPESCDDFKNRHDWFCCPKDSHPFTHICKSDREPYPTAFSIFARVIEQDEDSVTIDRFQKFGAVPVGSVTISRKDFDRCYKEYHDDI